MYHLSFLPLFALGASAQSVIKSWTGVKATGYYDLEHLGICTNPQGGPFGPVGWWNTINGGYTSCQGSGTTTYTLESLGSNRIVAMDLNADGKGPEYWCGKEVQIFDASGKQVILDEGPFVIYDNCGACGGGAIIDVSAKAFVQISGGKCGDNPTGLTVKVLDLTVAASGRPGNSGGAAVTTTTTKATTTTTKATTTTTKATTTTTQSTTTKSTISSKAATKSSTNVVTTTTKTAASTSSKASATPSSLSSFKYTKTRTRTKWRSTSTAPASTFTPPPALIAVISSVWNDDDEWTTICDDASKTSATAAPTTAASGGKYPVDVPSSCEMGKYVCDGKALKICNYVTWRDLGWQLITTCPKSCKFIGTELECI